MSEMYLAGVGASFQEAAASGPLILALGACVLAGLVSFASPCVVPLVPGYLSYLAGVVGADAPAVSADEAAVKTKVRSASASECGAAGLFVLGFTVVFVLATASVFGAISVLAINRELLMRIGGVVTIARPGCSSDDSRAAARCAVRAEADRLPRRSALARGSVRTRLDPVPRGPTPPASSSPPQAPTAGCPRVTPSWRTASVWDCRS